MSNTPNHGEPQPGSAPQPGAWGQPVQPPAADAAQAPAQGAPGTPAAPAWGSPSGYGAPQAQAAPGGWDQPAAPTQASPAGWDAPAAAQQPAAQGGRDAPAAAAPAAGAAPSWDQPAAQGNQDWAQSGAAQQGYGAPAYGAPAAGGYSTPGAPGTGGGYAVNYAIPTGLQGGLDGATNPEDLTRPLYGATFGQAIKRFFKNYVNFNGRASRSEFWWVALALGLLQLVPGILYTIGAGQVAATALQYADSNGNITDPQALAAAAAGPASLMMIGGLIMGLISLAIILPLLGLYWRRLHDANFTGLLTLLFLTGIGGIVVLVLCALESKPEGRRFDAAPGYAAY
ncbi:DUF805 domain-containing protein [Galactobacter valiniphilus]|uniref:DUF805 domain-containing protein n=1 Tax=Galactobacter valiniphilus TaxID=2676122 RepID=A0A399JG31_9MICC|nr:DUF805 domain-containing protein [Galactobacter valiniphilus]RII43607.1 DUF805 domain-containing protein [Galactobacter valiniphilus]